MNRREFIAVPLLLTPLLAPAIPAGDWGRTWWMDAEEFWRYANYPEFEMDLVVAPDKRSYGFWTLYKVDDPGLVSRGPVPRLEFDGPYTDMGWVERFFPEAVERNITKISRTSPSTGGER